MKSLVNKKEYQMIFLIGFLVSIMLLGVLMIKSIYLGTAISLQISIKISALELESINVDRVSRGGGQFPIAHQDSNSWKSTDWSAGIIITLPTKNLDTLTKIDIKLGEQSYSLDEKSIRSYTKKFSTDLSVVTFTPDFFEQRQVSHFGFFTSIINWPGDLKVIFYSGFKNLPLAIGCGLVTCLLLLCYLSIIKKVAEKPEVILDDFQKLRNLILILLFILTAISIYLFINNNPSAYDWPAVDMGPFFERQRDPTFLQNDFFTNVSSEPNPRFIFGYLILAITNLMGITWYQTFFLIKSLLTVVMPGVIFFTLIGFLRDITDNKKKALSIFGIFLFTLLIQNDIFRSNFTIALWSPYNISSMAQDVAFLFGFLGIMAYNQNRKLISYFLWFISTLLHPAIGFCLIIFYSIFIYNKVALKDYLLLLLSGILIPFTLLALLFRTEHPLNAVDFVYHYILANHSFHYLPSYFTSTELSPLPWYINFSVIVILLAISYFIGLKKSDRFLINVSLLGLITYVGCILVSYLFIEKFPIKIIAIIGPARYSMMGYWLIAVCYGRLLSYLPYKYLPILNFIPHITIIRNKYIPLMLGLCLSVSVGTIYKHYLDNPVEKWKKNNTELATWLINNTTDQDVFATNLQELSVNLPLMMYRPVFTGNGFPFREDDFKLYNERRWQIYGSPEDWKKTPGVWDGMWRNNFFRSRTPQDFLTTSYTYPLEYVIIEKNFDRAFTNFKPVYTNQKLSIYSVADFK